jgi:hypothetical protein
MRRVVAWLARLVGAVPAEEMAGARLEGEHWLLDGRNIASAPFFRSLAELVPAETVLVLEGGVHPPSLAQFLERNSVPPRLKVARGTLWPRASDFHVLATPSALELLSEITQNLAGPETCWHLHVHDGRGVVLEWYDAFDDGVMRVSKRLALPAVEEFCARLGVPRGRSL